jgi:hypothetical protein
VRVTSSSERASWSGSSISSSNRRQARGWVRNSPSERPSSRVSIGSSASEAGSSPDQPSSTGHIVVRPGVAGRMRRPVSAKKTALISSDLPRENSARGDHQLLVAEGARAATDLLAGGAGSLLGEEPARV